MERWKLIFTFSCHQPWFSSPFGRVCERATRRLYRWRAGPLFAFSLPPQRQQWGEMWVKSVIIFGVALNLRKLFAFLVQIHPRETKNLSTINPFRVCVAMGNWTRWIVLMTFVMLSALLWGFALHRNSKNLILFGLQRTQKSFPFFPVRMHRSCHGARSASMTVAGAINDKSYLDRINNFSSVFLRPLPQRLEEFSSFFRSFDRYHRESVICERREKRRKFQLVC